MLAKRKLAMVCGTLACALAIGHAMQTGNPLSEPTLTAVPIQQTELSPAPMVSRNQTDLVSLTDLGMTPRAPGTLASPDNGHASAVDLSQEKLRTPSDPAVPRLGCDMTAYAAAASGAMVDLMVRAPCNGNDRVTVHHAGMFFTATTDSDGWLMTTLPAFAEKAVVMASLPSGQAVEAVAHVPDVSDYSRIALQWSGPTGFELHALEFGATYGQSGHVWAGADATRAAGGKVVRLGAPDMLAPQIVDVYSFPMQGAQRSGDIQLSVEAEVTKGNCGQTMQGQIFELRPGQSLRARDLELSFPACTATGGFLVLNNLIPTLKIAGK